MVSDLRTACDLPIHHLIGTIKLFDEIAENSRHLLLSLSDIYIDHSRTSEHSVDMLVKQVDLIISRKRSLVDSVAKKVNSVVERHGQLVESADFTVIISKILHCIKISP